MKNVRIWNCFQAEPVCCSGWTDSENEETWCIEVPIHPRHTGHILQISTDIYTFTTCIDSIRNTQPKQEDFETPLSHPEMWTKSPPHSLQLQCHAPGIGWRRWLELRHRALSSRKACKSMWIASATLSHLHRNLSSPTQQDENNMAIKLLIIYYILYIYYIYVLLYSMKLLPNSSLQNKEQKVRWITPNHSSPPVSTAKRLKSDSASSFLLPLSAWNTWPRDGKIEGAMFQRFRQPEDLADLAQLKPLSVCCWEHVDHSSRMIAVFTCHKSANNLNASKHIVLQDVVTHQQYGSWPTSLVFGLHHLCVTLYH